MTRHPRRLYPATLTALVILAACAVTAVSLIQRLARRAPLIPFGVLERHLRTLRMDGAVMTYAGVAAAVIGLILLGCALLPGQPRTLPLAAGPGDGTGGSGTGGDGAGAAVPALAGVSRSGLRAALAATLAEVDGVDSVRVRVRRRRVRARVRTGLLATAEVRDAARDAVQRRLDQAGLARQPAVRVAVRVRRRAAA